MSTDNKGQTEPEQKTQEKVSATTQKAYGDFLGAYKNVSETTTKIVQQAATIFETEISNGIKMAHQTENQFPQMERFRTEPHDEIIQRFRRDAHEVIDIFVDVVGATLKSMPNMAEMATNREGAVVVKPVQVTADIKPMVAAAKAVKAGEKAQIEISFENSLGVPTAEFTLYCTDLINNQGDRLPASAIEITPKKLTIGPRMTDKISISADIPKKITPGTYSGLVIASNMPQLRSEIVVTVE
jgi:hypothetical protein